MIHFADRINFHGRNFPALFRAIESAKIPVRYFEFGDQKMKRAFGDYSDYGDQLREHHTELERLALPALFTHRYRGVRLYDACRFELLQRLMLEPRWYDERRPNDEESVFDAIARHAPEALVQNCAAAAFWVDYWQQNVHPEDRAVVGIFGNSLAYTRALALQAERLRVTPLVFEHFLTGHDHYMDVRRSPIQGFNELRLPIRGVAADRTLVLRRLAEMQNKNVSQASFRRGPTGGRPKALLLAQVVNDIAAIAPHNPSLGTVAIYKDLLRQLVAETDYEVVVKAHPYESHKTDGRGPVTREELRAFVAAKGLGSRVRIVESEPLLGLFEQSSVCLTLHSQGALEALARGIPVATLGDPFYAGHGFTHDFLEVDALVAALAAGELDALSEDEARRYFEFMTHAFRVLVNRDDSADATLSRLTALGVHADRASGAAKSTADDRKGFGARIRKSPFGRKAGKLVRDPKRFFVDAVANAKRRLR